MKKLVVSLIAKGGVVKQTSQLLEDVLSCSEITHLTHSTLICQAGLQGPDKGLLFCTLHRLVSHMPLPLQVELTGCPHNVDHCNICGAF